MTGTVRTLLGYFARRTGDPEVAADLAAETFASAIGAQDRYSPTGAPAMAWLYKIAMRRLADYQRRGWVERRVRRELAIERPPLRSEDVELIPPSGRRRRRCAAGRAAKDQREAVAAHVVEDRGYAELAESLHISEAVVRQRVSRGLAGLRRRIGGRS